MRELRRAPDGIPDAPTILAAARLSLKRLLAIQKPDGSLGYLYHPVEDKWEEKSNVVRLAGCAYALARAADFSSLRSERKKARHGVARLLSFLLGLRADLGSAGLVFIREPDSVEPWGKLGATALTALALQFSVGRRFRAESDALIGSILELQNPDGSFLCGIGRPGSPSAQEYFPGESLLALARYARRTGEKRASAALARAFPYYQAHFDNGPTTAFVPWQTDVWTRVAAWLLDKSIAPLGANRPSVEDLCGFVFRQVDWLLEYQHTQELGSPSKYLGGFRAPHAPTSNSATYIEAIILACDASALIGDSERIARYRDAALLGFRFLLTLQISPERVSALPRRELAAGGVTESLESLRMRCDYDQHFLTACLTALESPTLFAASE
jgi:hypothetical protein